MSVLQVMTVRNPAAELRRVQWMPGALRRPQASTSEFALLIAIGVLTAAARCLLRLRLGVPGHSILLVVPPLVFGLACVPRRMAGLVMGTSALGAGLIARAAGLSGAAGAGALTSLFLAGLLLEAALSLARSGRALYLLCLGAGMAVNLVAFGVRFAVKLAALGPADQWRPLSAWWPRAIWTYPACGALAGLVGAALLFRVREGWGESRRSGPGAP